MAKRKKLNKRVVVFLVIFGVILVGGGGIVLFSRVLPKDPNVYLERARKAKEAGNLVDAETAYNTAIEASEEKDPLLYFELAKLQLEMAEKPDIAESQRRLKLSQAVGALRTTLRRDPNYIDAQKLLTELLWKYSGGRWEDYIGEADRLIKLMADLKLPPDDGTYFRRGIAKARMASAVPGRYTDPAIADLKKAIELKSDDPQYRLFLISFYIELNRPEDAENEFKKAIEAIPDSADLHVSYARFLMRNDRQEEALQHIQQAVAREPDKTIGYLELAKYHARQQDFDKAFEALRAAKKIDESDYRVYQDLAGLYARRREPKKAAEAIREGLAAIGKRLSARDDQRPEGMARLRLGDARWRLNYFLADLLLDIIDRNPDEKDKLLAEARDSLRQLEMLRPDSPQRAKIAGRIALAEGKRDRAIELLEEADEKFNRSEIKTAQLLANLYMAGSPGKAERILKRFMGTPVLRQEPSILLGMALLQMRYRNYEEAAKWVDRVLQVDPEHEQAKKLKAHLKILSGSDAEVPKDVELSGDMIDTFLRRALTLWLQDRRDQAVRLLEDLRRRAPENVSIVQRLLTMYLLQGKPGEAKALALLKEALAVNPDDAKLKASYKLLNEPDEKKRLEMRLAMADANADPQARALEKAMVYGMVGMEKEYLEQLQQAAKIAPDKSDAVERLFTYAIGKRNWEIAADAVKRAGEANLDGMHGRLYSARLAMAKDDYDGAVKGLLEILEEQPNSKRALTMLGNCYLRTKQYEKAEETFSSVASSDPSYVAALIGMARATEALGKTHENEDWIKRAYLIAPQNSYVRDRMLAIQEKTAKPEEIIEKRLRIRERNPNDLNNLYLLGRLYERAKRPDKAEEIYKFIWEHPRSNKVTAARVLVNFYAQAGRRLDGVKILEQLLAQSEDKVAAYILWGQFSEGYAVAQAERAFQKAIEADPKDERGYLAMARHLGARGRFLEAANTMAKYLEIRPQALAYEKQMIQFLIDAREFDRASKRLDRILASDPSDAEALVLKGVLWTRQEQFDRALEILDRAIRETPKSFVALLRRSQVYQSMGDFTRAKSDLEEARKLTDSPQLAMELAKVNKALGDVVAAEAIYTDILDTRPDFAPAIRALLNLHMARKRWSAMRPLLDRAKARYPGDPSYLLMEEQMWTALRRPDLALAALEAALKIDSRNPQAVSGYLSKLIQLGQYARFFEAAKPYEKEPGFRVGVIALKGLAKAKQGNSAEADKFFVVALKDAEKNAVQFVVKQILEAYGHEGAIERIHRWIPTARPNDWSIYRTLGLFHLARNEFKDAEVALVKALALAKTKEDRARVNRPLGSVYHRLNKLHEAEKAYLITLESFPDDIQTMNNLAYLYTDSLKQPEKALAYARRAAGTIPPEPDILDTYGWTLAQVGKLRDAETQLVRALQLNRAMPVSRYHLGWVYEQKGLLDKAQEQYRLAFELIQQKQDDPLRGIVQNARDRVARKIRAEER